ncbi:MAG TPA: LysM domain-containing protein [Acidimicrobiales bacterium]|nr:LysM domain-containing protein [Acidimicrobiales bacterium]
MKPTPGAPVAGATAATTGGWRRTLALAAWTAGLVAVTRLLLAAGATSLAVPLASFDDLSAWASETPPVDMAMAVLRLAAIAGAVYLLAVTALATLAHLLRLRTAAAVVESISPCAVRRLVTGGSGIGLVVGGIVGGLPTPSLPVPASTATATPTAPTVPPPPAPAEAPPTASMTRLPGSPVTPAGEQSGGGPGPGTATMTRQDEPPPGSATMTRQDEPPRGSATMTRLGELGPVPSATPPAPAIDPTAWVVEPGDSFWSIAADVTAAPDGSPADERTVTRYWHALIEANRSHLADPRNPDLLVPGQHLTVPPAAG